MRVLRRRGCLAVSDSMGGNRVTMRLGMTGLRIAVRRVRSGFARTVFGCAVIGGVGLVGGCAEQGPARRPQDYPEGITLSAEEIARLPLERNVLRVAAFYDPHDPWLWSDDRARVRGIVIRALYLEGPGVSGVFGDGVIRPRLYLLDSSHHKPKPPKLIKTWAFDPVDALPFRSCKRTVMGWGYRLHLPWGDEFDLAGREIRMTVTFERSDGRVSHSDKKDFRVPGLRL